MSETHTGQQLGGKRTRKRVPEPVVARTPTLDEPATSPAITDDTEIISTTKRHRDRFS